MTTSTTVLIISAVCFVRADQHLLTVRKQGTTRFMLPGGKVDPGETAAQAAVREVAEELGLEVPESALRPLGAYQEAAANEADTRVDATIFTAALPGEPRAAREIAELRWTDLRDTPTDLAPLLVRHVVPALRGATV
ncbi:NUDIX hydrolase [Ruania alba]|uniref:ADP-ribose pyrophosphatase YjhB, NUDIX family n=1 Tax=Ruania alba TaxID=648782 RepID=A0A1H5HTM9_9MICO|nr:NUDIX domain-containing protein [Ruania alba]SEE31322.1 ADP-ribose pyrophosphatase YjhB, NUDIX family [Ruania alba]